MHFLTEDQWIVEDGLVTALMAPLKRCMVRVYGHNDCGFCLSVDNCPITNGNGSVDNRLLSRL